MECLKIIYNDVNDFVGYKFKNLLECKFAWVFKWTL